MTKLLGVIGYPLGQSISPAFQQAALDACGLDARYERWETPPEALERRIEELRTEELLGFNVTVPHKVAVFALLDDVTDDARAIGAVNAVVHREGRLVGHNTDAPGFLHALREEGELEPRGARVLVFGAGGAARAVCFALLHAGAAAITVANRSRERARALVEALDPPGAVLRVGEPDASDPVDLVVNCTPLGMLHGPAPEDVALAGSAVPSNALVYDLVYNPPETPLLRSARSAGVRTLGGLTMLVYQGAEGFRLWTGREPPLDVMMQAARRALGS